MNTDRKQKAAQFVIWQQDPFHATPVIKIRQRDFNKIWHAVRASEAWSGFFRLLFTVSEVFSMGGVILLGLVAGIGLAVGITGTCGWIAVNLLGDSLADISFAWFTIQSWQDYAGVALAVLTLFCLPYLWWGLPLTLTLRTSRTVHNFFARHRARQQALLTHNDDLSLLAEKFADYLPPVSRNGRAQTQIRWVAASGKMIGSLTGFIAALLTFILWVKFVLFVWSKGSTFWQMTVGWLSCLAGVFMPILLVNSFRSGHAVASMVITLFQGHKYREALDVTLDDLFAE